MQPLRDPTQLARFRQELKLARQLQHPNIVRLYDIGVIEDHRYLSMELLVGEDLFSRAQKGDADVPTDADIYGADKGISKKPECPAGGTYDMKSLADKPTCTIPDHVLPN